MQYLIDRERNKIKKFQILDTVDSSEYFTIIEIRIQEDLLIDFQAAIDSIYAADYRKRQCQYLFRY